MNMDYKLGIFFLILAINFDPSCSEECGNTCSQSECRNSAAIGTVAYRVGHDLYGEGEEKFARMILPGSRSFRSIGREVI